MKLLMKRTLKHRDSCGQFALAMAMDTEVEAVVAGIGRWGSMTTKEIEQFLIRKGYGNGRNEYIDYRLNGRGVLICLTKREGHVVAYEDGVIYDSNHGLFESVDNFLGWYNVNDKTRVGDWEVYAQMQVAPVKVREWTVGQRKQTEEVAL